MNVPPHTHAPVILHPGLPRTASTALQARLRGAGSELAPHAQLLLRGNGVLRPLASAALAFHKATLRNADTGASRAGLFAAVRDLRAGLEPDQRPIVISHEALAGHLPGLHRCWEVFPTLADIGVLLREAFAPHPVRFVVYTRTFDAWIDSAYNQAVKTERVKLDRDAFLAKVPPGASLSAPVEALRHALGAENLAEVALEDEAASPLGLGAGLLRVAGLPDEVIASLPAAPVRNADLPPGALSLMLKLNRSDLPGRKLQQVRRAISAHPQVFQDTPRRKTMPT
ncbi:hypothetical protein [Oceanibium sediminis]|uniref:hypothetical protein n=1 Tax=Oceanibium sediminis TaxID=2026339 RepID=UPI00130027B8|nr:hypothetical protein [Oceanibium sediminis]